MAIRRKADPLFTRVDDDLLGVDTEAGMTYTLNGPAARVWELLENWTTLTALCGQLIEEYEVEPAQCDAHVRALLAQLDEAGLVERQRAPVS